MSASAEHTGLERGALLAVALLLLAAGLVAWVVVSSTTSAVSCRSCWQLKPE